MDQVSDFGLVSVVCDCVGFDRFIGFAIERCDFRRSACATDAAFAVDDDVIGFNDLGVDQRRDWQDG